MKNNKKNALFAFVCSLVPGAGEMYMGLMKQGVSLMTMFFACVGLFSWMNGNVLVWAGIIVWCYSFFHVHHLRSLSEEEFQHIEDKILLPFNEEDFQFHISNQKIRYVGAVLLIFLGASLLWNYILDILVRIFPEEIWYVVWDISYDLPEAVVAVFIIWLGVRLIKGKKKALEEERNEANK